jgi:hypothetical protein
VAALKISEGSAQQDCGPPLVDPANRAHVPATVVVEVLADLTALLSKL